MSKRVLGKVFTYLGLLATGMGMLGILGPYFEMQRSERTTAQVVTNELAYRQPGQFGFRLQLKWNRLEGEQRTTITTVVRAPTEGEAWKKYKGNHLVAGQSYEFFSAPDNPERIQPFKGYNWTTFGTFGLLSLVGMVVCFTGIVIARRDRKTP